MNDKRILVLYHYFHPDDVVSARHYEDFCVELVERGWNVEIWPCNRGCRDESQTYPEYSNHKGVHVRRIWRPAFKQASFLGRLANAFWMISAWSWKAFVNRKNLPGIIITGTDPIFSILTGSIIKRFKPDCKLAHWCFDVHPEAAMAEGMISEKSWIIRMISRHLHAAYGRYDLVADIGACMRNKLSRYNCRKQITIAPWSLYEPSEVEPVDPETRNNFFGNARLGLLYSGNLGKAHKCSEFVALAEAMKDEDAAFCFAVRGNCESVLREEIELSGLPIKMTGFVPEEKLGRHLGSADIHLASLKSSWTGIVVPSKFFGSLAIGRPVIFAGSEDSAIAIWINEHKTGWVLTSDNISLVSEELRKIMNSAEFLEQMKKHCHSVYHNNFSKKISMNNWDRELRQLL